MARRRRGLEFDLMGRDRTGRAFASVQRGLKGIGASIGRLRTGLVAIATLATGAFTVLAKRAIDTADKIAKVADSVGITTDFLQEYRVAADLSGVSTEALDSAFQAFAKRLGEARSGTGTLLEFLKKMDPAFADLVRRAGSTERAIDLVVRKIAELPNQADRAALSAAAFGRTAGVEMTNLVRGGTAALEDMRQKARDLGLIIGEDLLRSAESAKDQLTLLATVIKTKVTVEILRLAPQIGALAQRFTEGLPTLIKWVEQFGIWVGLIDKVAPSKLEQVAAAIAAINKAQAQGTGAFGRGPSDRAGEIARRGALTEELNRLIELQDKFDRTRAESDTGAGGLGDTGGGAVSAPAVDKGTEALERQLPVVRRVILASRDMRQTRANLAAVTRETVETESALERATEDLGASLASTAVSGLEDLAFSADRARFSVRNLAEELARLFFRFGANLAIQSLLAGASAPASGGTGTGAQSGPKKDIASASRAAFNVVVNNTVAGADVQAKQGTDGRGRPQLEVEVIEIAARGMRRSGSPLNRATGQSFRGLTPSFTPRS